MKITVHFGRTYLPLYIDYKFLRFRDDTLLLQKSSKFKTISVVFTSLNLQLNLSITQ